ncbi:MAG: hypothetical protein ACK56F_01255 [bacterium]
MGEMIGIKLEAKETGDCKIDHSHFEVTFKSEKKENKREPHKTLIYYPSCTYKVSLFKVPGIVILSSYLPMFVLAWVIMAMY